MKKVLLSLIVSLCIMSQNLFADEQSMLKEYFVSTLDKVVVIVGDKSLDKEIRNDKIVQTLEPMFDFELMAKLSLGKKWRELNSIDQNNFVKLYVQRMKQSYSSKIDAYNNEKIEITELKQLKKNRIQLITNVINEEKEFKVVYKFYKPKKPKIDKNTWLIYDVVILGVSILKTDKAQFREFLQTKNIQELMDTLEIK